MAKQRRTFTAEQKVGILKRHLLEKVPVSDLCDELGIHPTLFYNWQKEFFENGAAAFLRKGRKDDPAQRAADQIASLQGKLTQKNEVLAELMGEYVALKKKLNGEN